MLEMKTVLKSSNVGAYGYDAEAKCLVVEFRSGKSYRYMNVPEKTASGLDAAESKGRFVAAHVVDKFDFEPVEKVDAGKA